MLADVVADLDWVHAYWPDLTAARLPLTTPRPWRQAELSKQVRAERDAQARAERFDRTELSFGESPAPVDVNVLTTALDLLVYADDLAAALAAPAMCPPLPSPARGDLDARPYLHYAAARLHELRDESLAEWAAPYARWMYDQAAAALAMVYDGQVLDVICPWCDGRTPEAPVGGARTWRVVTLPGDQIAIVCSGACEPPAKLVGTWWYGQPCWPISEWERLAKHVRAGELGHDVRVTMAS